MRMIDEYKPRIVDAQIKDDLEQFGALYIVGPKWCGKTTTAETVARSALYMQDPDESERYLEIAKIKVSNLLVGDSPRLIDEWQMSTNIWDAVRYSVDHENRKGMYILTGSVTVERGSIKHSGTGRIAKLVMRTMSLYESGESTGEVSLKSLFEGLNDIEGVSKLGIPDIAEIIVRGGWPGSISSKNGRAVAGYCRSILDSEFRLHGKKRNKSKMELILKSLSRNTASGAPDTKILADINQDSDSSVMSLSTLKDYLNGLESIFVTEDMNAWCPNLRSKTVVRTSKTRYMSDPAIAAFFLGASARDLEYDPNTFGLLFETLVIRDLRVYVQGLDGEVFHYRDKDDLEVDAIIHLWNGRWAAVEVKLGSRMIEEAAANLKKLKKKVDEKHENTLSFLAVITGTGIAYTREDGIHVIPIGCLKD